MRFLLTISFIFLSIHSQAQPEFNIGSFMGYHLEKTRLTTTATEVNSGIPVTSENFYEEITQKDVSIGVAGRINVYDVNSEYAVFIELEPYITLDLDVSIPLFVSFGWGLGASPYSDQFIGFAFGTGINYFHQRSDFRNATAYDPKVFSGYSPILKAALFFENNMGMQSINVYYSFSTNREYSYVSDDINYNVTGANTGFTLTVYWYFIK